MVSEQLLIYGATGYTGRLIAGVARERGLRPLLGGRNEAKLAAVSEELGFDYRVAGLDSADELDAALIDVSVVLNAAGPFSRTWRPVVDACLKNRAHYLDISGEIPVIEGLVRLDARARERGLMIMPGVGFDVVPSDCLAAHVARRLPGARRLWLGLTGLAFATRGSAKTLAEHAGEVHVRRDGVITPLVPGSLRRSFDYGDGERESLNVSADDVILKSAEENDLRERIATRLKRSP